MLSGRVAARNPRRNRRAGAIDALDTRPDVIFFLSDGEIPEESVGEIRRLNSRGKKVVIHAIAFGDNYNDVAMLDLVGTPYIMDGAAAPLRARYPLHTPRPEDVLREVLRK